MNQSTKKICITAMGISLFVVLSLCLQVPVFENYYLCLGYVVMTVFCYYMGPISGMAVGGFGVVLYCLLTSGLRGMPGWAIGNLVIGLIVGLTCRITLRMKNQWLRHLIIGFSILVSVAIAMLGIKSLVEAVIYAQPMVLRIIKNTYAFVADVVVMMVSLPICVSLKSVLHKTFGDAIAK
ncbi:MAG: ECF transporter S component [Ruminococcaceae bacterium]|nr:ECF transporter S component [Oscillospiraceae bacterium]